MCLNVFDIIWCYKNWYVTVDTRSEVSRDEGQLTNCTVAWRNLPPHCGCMDQPIPRIARIGSEDTAEITSATLFFPQPDFRGQRDERKCGKCCWFSWHNVPSCHVHSWCLHVLQCFECPACKEVDVLCFTDHGSTHIQARNRLHDQNISKLLWWGEVSKYVDILDFIHE